MEMYILLGFVLLLSIFLGLELISKEVFGSKPGIIKFSIKLNLK